MTDAVIILAGPVTRTVGVDYPPMRLAPRSLCRRVIGRRVTLFLAHSEVTRDP